MEIAMFVVLLVGAMLVLVAEWRSRTERREEVVLSSARPVPLSRITEQLNMSWSLNDVTIETDGALPR